MRRLFIFLLLLLAPTLAHAQRITPELVAEGPIRAGGEVELAIHMRPAPGWHGYWLNPGDAGLPMDVKWQLPPGFSVGPLRYPVPTRLEIAGLMNYVYEQDYAVLVRLKAPAGVTGSVPIRASATWLACTDKVCVPEEGEFGLDVPSGGSATMDTRFNAWRRALPRPLASIGRFAVEGDTLRVAIPLPASVAVRDAYVFPMNDGSVDYAAEQDFSRSGDTLIAELPRSKGPPPREFGGVLSYGKGLGLAFTAEPGVVEAAGTPLATLSVNAVLWAVLATLLGGILLNLMPCVFPILALKALHLSRAGGDAAHARSDALAYAGGAVVGTGALGLALLAIRAAGVEAGWAFQLQDPRTIVLLLLLATAITANLLGLFDLPVLGGRAQPAGGFATGALAAFVATPCAGPFLGVALGTALLLPPAGSLLVFAALGLGLAIPFLLVAFIPALRRKLPRPGAWMQRLQRFLAIPMAASALAALWLFWRQTGGGGLVLGAAAATLLILLLAGLGYVQRRGLRAAWTIATLAALLIAVALWQAPSRSGSTAEVAGAEKWSPAQVATYVARGNDVFVYFTADWCLTCKVNEATAIGRDEVHDAFDKAGVKVLAADWTNGDPAITRFLESRGRAGVPYYLWYRPGRQPEELPQILTPSMLISRARRAE